MNVSPDPLMINNTAPTDQQTAGMTDEGWYGDEDFQDWNFDVATGLPLTIAGIGTTGAQKSTKLTGPLMIGTRGQEVTG